MELNLERVLNNVQKATTEDLLDRATVYRRDMEPNALEMIDAELVARGITREDLEAHLERREGTLRRGDGSAIKCSFCYKPAVQLKWEWHRLFGVIPVFPRKFARCGDHLQ